MPLIPRPYELVSGIRLQAEKQRIAEYQRAIRGSIAVRSITAEMIAIHAITNEEIGFDTILGANVAPLTLTGSEVANGTITGTKVQAQSLTNTEIADGTIRTNEIAANTITSGDIAVNGVNADRINAGSLSAITANLGTVTAGSINGATITLGSGTPHVFGDSTGIRAVGNGASYRFFNADESDRTGAARCNIPVIAGAQIVQAEMVAYAGFANDGNTQAGIRVRNESSDAEMGYLKVTGNGNLVGSDTAISASDRALKKSIRNVKDPLDAVLALKPRRYNRKRSGLPDAGFVAQEVEEVLPDLVHHDIDDEGNSGVAYAGIHAYTVGAIQELAARVEKLEQA